MGEFKKVVCAIK